MMLTKCVYSCSVFNCAVCECVVAFDVEVFVYFLWSLVLSHLPLDSG